MRLRMLWDSVRLRDSLVERQHAVLYRLEELERETTKRQTLSANMELVELTRLLATIDEPELKRKSHKVAAAATALVSLVLIVGAGHANYRHEQLSAALDESQTLASEARQLALIVDLQGNSESADRLRSNAKDLRDSAAVDLEHVHRSGAISATSGSVGGALLGAFLGYGLSAIISRERELRQAAKVNAALQELLPFEIPD